VRLGSVPGNAFLQIRRDGHGLKAPVLPVGTYLAAAVVAAPHEKPSRELNVKGCGLSVQAGSGCNGALDLRLGYEYGHHAQRFQ